MTAALHNQVRERLDSYWVRRCGHPLPGLEVEGASCWDLRLRFQAPAGQTLHIRPLAPGDEALILALGRGLGDHARDMFCPYPWDAAAPVLAAAVAAGVQQAFSGADASYLLLAGRDPVGYFFLWKAGGNPHAQAHGVQIPELGIAIADGWQGQGLGGLAVRLLLTVAAALDADAVELTTALANEAGWRTYLGAGFLYLGTIQTPLDVDVTAAIAGQAEAARYREERQMVYVVAPERREAVLRYLASKREELAALAGAIGKV